MKTEPRQATSEMAQAQQRAADRAWEGIRTRQIAAFMAEEKQKAEIRANKRRETADTEILESRAFASEQR